MKKFITIILTALFLGYFLLIQELQAQAPSKMSYQALVRNTSNAFVNNQPIGMKISILGGSATGNAIYVETQTPTSNAGGLISIEIGSGTAVTGQFSSIDWSDDSYFIKTELDLEGGTNYTITGTSQLLSVPYALYAEKAGNTFSGSYNDLTDVPAGNSFDGAFTSLTDVPSGLSDGDDDTQLNESEVDAFVANNGYLSTEVDGSITNEIQDLSLSGNNLTITNNGSATTIDLSGYLDNTDTQLNESQVDTYVANNGYLTAEVDGSTTNEIQDLSLSGNNLTITNNGSATTIDLSGYLDNTDTQLNESQVDAYVANNGYLTTEVDGSVTNEIELPVQTGHSGKYLTTNGSAVSWANVSSGSALDVVTISTSTTLSATDQIVFINGAYTATLPASPVDGQRITICAIDQSAAVNGNGRSIHLAATSLSSLTMADATVNIYNMFYSSSLDAWFSNY